MTDRYTLTIVPKDSDFDMRDIDAYYLNDTEGGKRKRILCSATVAKWLMDELNSPKLSERHRIAARANGLKGGRPPQPPSLCDECKKDTTCRCHRTNEFCVLHEVLSCGHLRPFKTRKQRQGAY